MQELIGKTIKEVYTNSSKDFLLFVTNDDNKYYYAVEGDCCSYSWVEHITLCGLFEAPIINISIVGGDNWEEDGDFIDSWIYEILTAKGASTIEMRNSSNGYYSGYVIYMDPNNTYDNDRIKEAEKSNELKLVTEEF